MIDNEIMSMATSTILNPLVLTMEKPKMRKEVRKSRLSMMLLLLTRSARIPPKGDSRMVGSMETASMVANMDALLVTCNT